MVLISREAALNTIRDLEKELAGEGKPSPLWAEVTNWLYISIANLPIESRIKGEWVDDKAYKRYVHCSHCGLIINKARAYYRFCFMCGTDMRGDENDKR